MELFCPETLTDWKLLVRWEFLVVVARLKMFDRYWRSLGWSYRFENPGLPREPELFSFGSSDGL